MHHFPYVHPHIWWILPSAVALVALILWIWRHRSRSVLIAVDASGSMIPRWEQAMEVVKQILRRTSGRTRVGLMVFTHEIQVVSHFGRVDITPSIGSCSGPFRVAVSSWPSRRLVVVAVPTSSWPSRRLVS